MPKLSSDQISSINNHPPHSSTENGNITELGDSPFKPEKSSNPFDENYFEDCFNNDPNEKTDYEQQLQMEAQKTCDQKKLGMLKLKAEQARADQEATQKLNQVRVNLRISLYPFLYLGH